MPLYRIERPVGEVSQEEIDAAALRAVACMQNFPGMAWKRSFHDPVAGQLTCYYEARRPEDIRLHAEYAHIACERVTEVVEYLPDAYR